MYTYLVRKRVARVERKAIYISLVLKRVYQVEQKAM